MARFSDMLGGDDADDKAASDRPAPEPPPRETPEDILDRLTHYATARPAAESAAPPEPTAPAEPAAAAEGTAAPPEAAAASAPGPITLDTLPPVDDDLLPRKNR